ncbi:SMI1/KNR4 family protein [Actinokineospora pegani]|uniref:SMI1/KNR4 family protein n=1 Tax=Actinokineospora pegani TaxID=2654637 RepID=UPI0012EA171F|nr:SMI1/KNR4 family protein [Actinokineospora pegani]
MTPLDELVSISGPGIGSAAGPGCGNPELERLLGLRNGFFAFESALLVFPWGGGGAVPSVQEWNSGESWRSLYPEIPDGVVFFAEDVFGEQFALTDGRVERFSPETGVFAAFAEDLGGWADHVLDDFANETGHPLAHAWQVANGALPTRVRLVPRIPFTLGGEYRLDNLVAMDRLSGIEYRAEIARQIRGLPNGTTVSLKAQ